MSRRALAACAAVALLPGAAASVAETVAQAPRSWWYDHGPTLTADFGAASGNRSEAVAGSLVIRPGGRPGFEAVQWTTANISLPASLVEQVCGGLPGTQTFTYSINVKWDHGSGKTSGQGPEECGEPHTGKHWDPTAVCSNESSNQACQRCDTAGGYMCDPASFSPRPDSMGSFAYRFLNKHACELGDLSGMHGELESANTGACTDRTDKCQAWVEKGECKEHPEFLDLLCPKSCRACIPDAHVALKSLTERDAGLAQMSTPFGVITDRSVDDGQGGPSMTCDALGPPPAHATGCDCLRQNGRRSESIGSMAIFRPWHHETFYLGGVDFDAMRGRSVVVQCGSAFGAKKGEPLMCAKLA